ncbi:hypothetical protein MSAN_01882300 [Mycena sanguinolenta]|uniref:Uncharacterized protein n=1 Tax=Mycena sanguinolenta TaxID=230812 RepID=A0A8H7CSE8_9AGAR|nr:hypothetical protein MSAN_01882300 [Mycena sanguinolenta]
MTRRAIIFSQHPPSPRRINSPSPSLSESNSNSAGSTTEPTTPPSAPHGRVRKLYPEGVGRVPLHRRGTSKTYERLEDLLREAGYKETRIFTPETERMAPAEEVKSPIGAAFVGFLSSFVPNRSSSIKRDEEQETEVPVYSPPVSPVVNRTQRASASRATRRSESQQTLRLNSNAASGIPRTNSPSLKTHGSKAGDPSGTLSPRRSVADMQQQQRQRVDSVVAPLPSDNLLQDLPPLRHPRPVNRYYQHHPSFSRGGSDTPSPPPPQHQPTPTRASTYLRHMTSFDRPQSTPPTYTRMTDDAEEESLLSPTMVPRMPTNWMENVKRARQYFGSTTSINTTPLAPISASPAPTVKLNRSVSAKTRGRLSDRTNANTTPAPPLLTTRLSTTRAKRSESQVSVSRVVCRSRGSSPVRRDKGKGPARTADLDLRGQLELPGPDELNFAVSRSRFLSGWGTGTEASAAHAGAQLLSPPRGRVVASFDSGESDISSEGEEELTLERILVPSRHAGPAAMERSRSVRSLRRCLELDGGHGQSEVPPVPPLPAEGSNRWSLSLSWGRARTAPHSDAEDADPDLYVRPAASGRSTTRQRPVLPSWAN